MQASFYLVIQGKRKWSRLDLGKVSVTKKKPDTAADEIAVRVSMDIPDSLFAKPTLEASIAIPPGSPRDSVITAAVQENIAAIIKEQTGLTVIITAPEVEP